MSIVDVRNPTNFVALGQHKTVGQVYDLWTKSNYAFIAEGWEGLRTVEVSEPGSTVVVETVPTWGEARGVQLENDCIYVAEAGSGLAVLGLPSGDLSILQQPASVSTVAGGETTLSVAAFGLGPLSYQWYAGQSGDMSQPLAGATGRSLTISAGSQPAAYWVRVSGASEAVNSQTVWVNPVAPVSLELLSFSPGYRRGPAWDVELRGNLAYVAAGGLQIWDITDAESPRLVGSYDQRGEDLYKFRLSGNLALLDCSDYSSGAQSYRLEILDISNPATPRLVGTHGEQNYINSVAGKDTYAYLLAGGTLEVLDLSDPAQPKQLAALELGYGGESICLQGSFVYLTGSSLGLDIVDIADPAHPRLVGSCPISGSPNSVAVDGDYAYITVTDGNSTGLLVFNVSNRSLPSLVARAATTEARDVFVANGVAWVAAGSSGLVAFDVSHPASLRSIGTNTTAVAGSVAVTGTRACVTLEYGGLEILDVNNPGAPTTTSIVETYDLARSVAVSGGYAYVAEESAMQIIDVSDPRNPVRVGSYDSWPGAMAVSGQYLILGSFEILDLTDPVQPKPLSTIQDTYGTSLALANNRVYLTTGSSLRTIDISDPAAPLVVSDIQSYASGVAAWQNIACLACGWDGMPVLDMSLPGQPRRQATYYADGSVVDVAGSGTRAYVVLNESAAVELVDLSDPRRPARVSTLSVPSASKAVVLPGSYLCVAGDELRVLDYGDPAHPVSVGRHPLGMQPLGMVVSGDLIYVAAGNYGVAIFRLKPQLALNPPVLKGSQMQLTWMGSPGVRLQRSPGLTQPDWQDVPNTDGASSAGVPASTNGFYRLVRH